MWALLRVVCGAVMLVLVAGALTADQTGEIRGSIADETGGVLPGVAVTARSRNLQGVRTTISDGKGFFRLPLLPVGSYDVTFELQGFEELTLTGNEVHLGYTASLSVVLKLATFEENITVTAAPQLIDRTRGDTSYRLRDEELSRIPTQARTVAEVVAFTPGVTGVRTDTVTGTDTGLPSFRGEGDAGNNWLVDGLSIKGANANDPAVRINYDAWDEVQVISDGFVPELGQAVGGFVNIVTKSGGNEFHGEVGALIRDRRLRSAREPQLSAASLPETSYDQYFANLGGPILRDKLWFFLSDNYISTEDQTTDQTIGWLDIAAGERLAATNNVFGKLTYTPRTNHTFSAGGTLDESLDQSGGIGVPETYTKTTYSDTSYRLNYMGILSENTLITAAAGQNRSENSVAPMSGDYGPPSYFWQDISQRTNNIEAATTGLDKRTDLALGVGTLLGLGRWGNHEIKAGLSHYENELGGTFNPPGYAVDPWPGNSFDDGVLITWASPSMPLELAEYKKGRWKDATRGFGVYVQDTLSTPRFSFMLGLRADTQEVFNDAGTRVWSWGVGDFLQPRVSLVVDVTGDGRNVFKGGYGWFSMPIAAQYLTFVNETWAGTFRSYHWVGPAEPTDAQLKDPTNWQFVWEQSGAATPMEVDPRVKPNRVSRYVVGFDRQLGTSWAVRLRGVYSRSPDLLEDIAVYAPDTAAGFKYVFTNFQLKKRDYRALELELNGRAAGKLMLDASYTWSRAKGTNPGNSFERGSWATGGGSFYDGGVFGDRPYMPPGAPNKELYDALFAGLGGRGIGDEGWYGYLPYSVDDDVKILATYLAPHGVQIACSVEWLSGYHWEKKGWSAGYGLYLTFPEGRGARTTPAVTYVDLAAEKDFQLGHGLALGLGVNVYNLFNSQRPVSYVKEDTTLFGQVWARQLPRWIQLKLGLKF